MGLASGVSGGKSGHYKSKCKSFIRSSRKDRNVSSTEKLGV